MVSVSIMHFGRFRLLIMFTEQLLRCSAGYPSALMADEVGSELAAPRPNQGGLTGGEALFVKWWPSVWPLVISGKQYLVSIEGFVDSTPILLVSASPHPLPTSPDQH